MKLVIHNNSGLPLIDYRLVKPLQGNLKELSTDNYNKLKKVLEKRGFTAPLFLWRQGKDYFLMDGHQRQRVMVQEKAEPYLVPYLLIDARDEQDARQQLLELTSQYGHITQEGIDEFIIGIDLPEAELASFTVFDALPLWGSENDFEPDPDDQGKLDEKKQVTCPDCGAIFTP